MNAKTGIEMVVFDWAGTTVDYGSSAPMVVFERVFSEAGIALTRKEINGPMGMEKKSHIRTLLTLKRVSEKWEEIYKAPWSEADVERLYVDFEKKLKQVVAEYSTPIDKVTEAVQELRQAGIKIGSTTGYTSEMMEQVIPGAKALGYCADCVITPDVTGIGRPTPFMLYECMRRMNVYPPCRVVKVGDTVTDIREGKNAAAWSVGILTGSNLLGLTKAEYDSMSPEELACKKQEAKAVYLEAGADYVIDNMSELPELIRAIDRRMEAEKE